MAFQQSFEMGAPSHPESHAGMSPDMIMMNPWMQVPSSIMPWNVDTRPDLIRFGNTSREDWGLPGPKLKCCKRKPDLDINPRPIKMHISEEKMAAQLKNMHISNKYPGEQGFGDIMDSTDCFLPSLVLSKEVQNLPYLPESFLPESLLQKLERPTRALVLWKPPAGSFSTELISSLYSNTEEEANSNNNTLASDLNSMTAGLSCSSTDMEL